MRQRLKNENVGKLLTRSIRFLKLDQIWSEFHRCFKIQKTLPNTENLKKIEKSLMACMNALCVLAAQLPAQAIGGMEKAI